MNRKVYRFFYGLMDVQERFLNRFAKEGWRLVRTSRFLYEFEPCQPGQYCYCVDFVAQMGAGKANEYQQFLEDMGYRVMPRPMNVNWSLGKVRLRPWASKWGKVASVPGAFNKEVFVVEKVNDGTPFQLHTTLEDRTNYYRLLRNVWLYLTLLFAGAALLFVVKKDFPWRVVVSAILALLHGMVALHSHILLTQMQTDSRVTES